MYLPVDDKEKRASVTKAFREYCQVEAVQLEEFRAYPHWAKLEPPPRSDIVGIASLRKYVAGRFDVQAFNAARRELDPYNIMANGFIDAVFGDPRID